MGALEDSVRKSTAKILVRDQAVRDLALKYARDIDGEHGACEDCGCRGGGDLTRLGPALLAALEALQLSPRARKAVTPIAGAPRTNPLDELARVRARKGRAAAVDPAAP
jgi:hypothetical protein